MILRDALDIRRGTAQRNKIYKGTYKVWDRNKIALEGYCKQETTKGKQLFDVNDIYDKNSLYRKDEDDYITIEFDNSKGTTAKFFNYYTNKSSNLKLDTKYYIATEIKEVSGTGTINIASTYQTQSQIKNSIYYDLSGLKNNDIKVDETTTVSDFTERIIMIRTYVKAEAGQKGSITFRISVLEKEPTAGNFVYEKYTGGQPSPNPDYPQPIEVMQGRQVVNIKNNNYCFTKASDWKIGQYNMEGAIDDTSTMGLKRIRLNGLIPVPQDTQLYFDTFLNPYQLVIRGYDNNKNFVGSYGAVPNKTILNTSGRGIKYLGVSIFNSSGEETTGQTILDKIQSGEIKPFICLNSEEDKSFKPYKNEQYTVDLKSKQLFDVNDIYDNAGQVNVEDWITITGDNSQGEAVLYKNYFTKASKLLRKNTTYHIVLEIKAITGQGRIVFVSNYSGGTSASQFKNSISYNFSDLNNQNIIITNDTTKDDFTNIDTMLKTYVSFNAGQSGSITFRLSVLEEQPTVENFNYEPYYDYKLAGIGDVKDNFYTDKGKWYFKQNIGNVVLDGSEEWSRSSAANNYAYFLTVYKRIIESADSLCNYFQYTNIYGYDIIGFDTVNVHETFFHLRIGFGINTAITDVTNCKNWLAEHNLEVYCPLATPTVEEITAPTLINQLNALYQAI